MEKEKDKWVNKAFLSLLRLERKKDILMAIKVLSFN